MYDVSVIIPIYNGEKFLKKCLDSVTNQTLNNIEIICVNDGSTDGTEFILEKYSLKYKNLKMISVNHGGQGVARNIALDRANGEYIAFIDADDWVELNALELLYDNAKKNNLDLLFYQMVNYIDATEKLVETDLYNHKCFCDNNIGDNVIFNHEDAKNFLFDIPVGPVSKLYKKEFLKSYNLRFPEGFLFEDNAFFYNVFFKCTRAGFLEKQLYYRRRHENSVTQTLDKSKFDIIKATNAVLDVFLDNKKYEDYKNDVINHTFSMLIEWFKKSPLNLRQEFYKLIKTNFKGFNELKNDFNNSLDGDYLVIFNCVSNNDYYLDFLSEYKLDIADYVIYDNGQEYELGSDEYNKYKSELMPDYKITVIIPIYNNDRLIHRTLMSIENQSFGIEKIEVLMIDDFSSDDTYNVIKKYSDQYKGFKAIHIKKGTGAPGTPRNIGLLEASSKYIIFLDHDDLFEINALETLYNSIEESNCDFVYGTYASIDTGLPTKIVYPNEKHGYFSNIYENERSIAFPPPSIWTKLFKKDFLIDNKILFPTILGEDAIFVSKALIKANGINYLWDTLICLHNLSEDSYTNKISFKYLIEGFTSEEYLYDFYKIQGNELFYKIRGEGILDFYLTQFYKSNLTEKEIINIFPALYDFTKRMADFRLTPHVSETNLILFDLILNKDVNQIIVFKKVDGDASKKKKIKNFIRMIIDKVIR